MCIAGSYDTALDTARPACVCCEGTSDSSVDAFPPQVPFFVDTESGEAVMAAPPPGVPPLAVLSAALSAALGSPLPLPLEALLAAPAAELPSVAAAVSPGGMGSVSGGCIQKPCQHKAWEQVAWT